MHGSSLARMAWFIQTYLPLAPGTRLKVLDVGSMEVAGGSYRPLFPADRFEYAGLDLEPGPNVDIVPDRPYAWTNIPPDAYDVVISGQALEHMEFFWLAAVEMTRVLKPGGLMCLIAPRGFGRHRHPVDCWRFDVDGMVAIARWCALEPLHASTDMAPPGAHADWHIEGCEDSLLVARKPAQWGGPIGASSYQFQGVPVDALQGGFVPCPPVSRPDTVPKWQYEDLRYGATHDLQALVQRLVMREEEAAYLRRRLEGYEQSCSWRITRPLRLAGEAMRKLWHRLAHG